MDFYYVVVPVLIALIGFPVAWFSLQRILSLRKRNYPTWRNVMERIVLSLMAIGAVTVAGISGVNAVALRANKLPGETYMVDAHRMRIDCTGSGSPTIVLEAGAGNDGLNWGGVQPVLAKTTRICSYDRAGFGGSEPVASPRDADHIAADLHGLLLAAKIEGPIILMGHSFGGVYIRDYATRYPAAVDGLIFVDSSTPLQNRNPVVKAYDAKAQPGSLEAMLKEVLTVVGIPRLLGRCSPSSFPEFDAEAAKLQAEDRCHERFETIRAEGENMDRSGEETVHAAPYGGLPILIFSQDPATAVSRGYPINLAKVWNKMQEDLKRLSTRSRRIIAKGSGHFIQLDRPDLIEKDVPLFIGQVRGTLPEPTDYGSTTTE